MRKRHKIIIIRTAGAFFYSVAIMYSATMASFKYGEAQKGKQYSDMVVAFYKAEAARARKDEYAMVIDAYACITKPVKVKPLKLPEIVTK